MRCQWPRESPLALRPLGPRILAGHGAGCTTFDLVRAQRPRGSWIPAARRGTPGSAAGPATGARPPGGTRRTRAPPPRATRASGRGGGAGPRSAKLPADAAHGWPRPAGAILRCGPRAPTGTGTGSPRATPRRTEVPPADGVRRLGEDTAGAAWRLVRAGVAGGRPIATGVATGRRPPRPGPRCGTYTRHVHTWR